MQEIELEKTYLAKFIPQNIADLEKKELLDIYIPILADHPTLRIRKKGNNYEMTKKSPVSEGDASRQTEHTIKLSEEEYDELSKVTGKRVKKTRYHYKYNNLVAEIDVFQDALAGLILIDFEFNDIKEKDEFVMPEFCLADVTQEKFTAGGMLCGKEYSDIETDLDRFNYKKLFLKS